MRSKLTGLYWLCVAYAAWCAGNWLYRAAGRMEGIHGRAMICVLNSERSVSGVSDGFVANTDERYTGRMWFGV
jgi:hypothetical protein